MFIYSSKFSSRFPIVPCRCRRVFKKALPAVSSECHAKLCELLPESPHSFIGQFFLSLFVVPPPSSLSVPSSPSSLPTRDAQLTSTVPLALSIWINVFEVTRTLYVVQLVVAKFNCGIQAESVTISALKSKRYPQACAEWRTLRRPLEAMKNYSLHLVHIDPSSFCSSLILFA